VSTLAPATVEPALKGRFGRPYLYAERCESTQTMLGDDPPEGAIAVCDQQTAGRGRLGRHWETVPGTSVLCSVALRPPADRRAAELSLVGGMAAADAVELALKLAVQIKWPNDVMVNRFKVAGVLAEARNGVVVLGIGINVNQTRTELPTGTKAPVASLRTIDGVVRARTSLLVDLLDRLEHNYDRWREGGLDAIYDFLGARDFLRGRRVSFDGTRALAVGIDRAGRLELDVGGERRLVESGEIDYEQ
jgi:BirA family transcriptional regulator, biotin operon repressor / biotin---[acetyl-CoA-carboxylase] ligase